MIAREDKYVYGNRGGQTLMEEIEDMKRQTHQIPRLIAQIEHQERRVATLEGQVGLLTRNSESYLCIRQRFLDVYKRDIRGIHALQGSKAIREGNVKAHEGDALTDASLFSNDQRSDTDLYQELYGLEHKQVLEIHGIYKYLELLCQELIKYIDSVSNDGAILTVLNAHATVLAQGKPISDDLEVAFKKFLCQVEKNWLKSPRQEAMTPLGMAYCNFWKIFKMQYPS